MYKLLLTTALAGVILIGPAMMSQSSSVTTTPSDPPMVLDDRRGVMTMAPLLERVTPSVVSIQTEGTSRSQNPQADEFFERFFGQTPQARQTSSIGSGVIIDADQGYVMTNHHVVDDADEIVVTLQDKREFTAELIGGDARTDIAVLKIKAQDLTAIQLAPEDSTRVGDYVIAIGNAFGLEHTVTSGIVSALGRTVSGGDRLQDMIQTDASINPGNSGGALINSNGELIGINTMILSRSGGNNGIGFAVPTDMAMRVMDQLVEYGEVRRGRIGVSIRDIDPALQEAMGLSTRDGALVNDVTEDSPAERAGLKSGDIITGFNGETIKNSNDIRNAVGLVPPGTRSDLTYMRNGREKTTKITVDAFEDDFSRTSNQADDALLAGATLGNIPDDMQLQGGKKGVLILSVTPASKAQRAGLRRGDIIRKVGSETIDNLRAFEDLTENRDGPIALTVERDGSKFFVAIR